MTNGDKDRLATGAIIALTFISVAAILAGIVVAYFGQGSAAAFAIISGAVGGIVAIVLQGKKPPS